MFTIEFAVFERFNVNFMYISALTVDMLLVTSHLVSCSSLFAACMHIG